MKGRDLESIRGLETTRTRGRNGGNPRTLGGLESHKEK